MSNESLDLSVLNDFVTEIFSSTEATKRILEIECNQARNILRACPIETIVTKEIDEACCTCECKTSFENHTKEIVDGIGKALAQAQQLREKIAINMSRENRKARRPNVEKIYSPDDKKISKNSTKSLKLDTASEVSQRKSQIAKSSPEAQKNSFPSDDKSQSKQKTKIFADKKLLRLSAGNTMSTKNIDKVKTTKNFIAANKSNLKSSKQNSKSTLYPTRALFNDSKSRMDLSPLSGNSRTPSDCSISIAKLNNLMDKFSLVSRKSLSKSRHELENPDCPYHRAHSQRVFQQRVRDTVDLIEGLDRFGIPAEISRPLKIYRSYTRKESSETEFVEKKGERAMNRFLAQFEKLNENRRIRKEKNYHAFADLMIDFASFFRDLYVRFSEGTSVDLERNGGYNELDRRGKNCHLEKFAPTKFRKKKNAKFRFEKDAAVSTGWSSNGIWNPARRDSFPATKNTRCIKYANKSQLLLFFELDQRLQLLLYHRNLLDLLMNDVIPKILEKFDRDATEYRESYKMLFTISQVLNPCVTVLVRTDA